jgi:hypothetical protein
MEYCLNFKLEEPGGHITGTIVITGFMMEVSFKCEHIRTIARELAETLKSILEGTFGDQTPQPRGCVHYPSVNVRELPDEGASIYNGKDRTNIHQKDAIQDLVQWLEADWPILQSNMTNSE